MTYAMLGLARELLFAAGVILLQIGLLVHLYSNAPVGYQDERGFHFGKPKTLEEARKSDKFEEEGYGRK